MTSLCQKENLGPSFGFADFRFEGCIFDNIMLRAPRQAKVNLS